MSARHGAAGAIVAPMPRTPDGSPRRLALFLVGSGVMHFARPKFYDPMIPAQLPGPRRAWTLGSGVVEIVTGAAVGYRRTRRLGALAAVAVFLGVFPANIKMAIDVNSSQRSTAAMKAGTIARLPLQWPMITWALKVRRAS